MSEAVPEGWFARKLGDITVQTKGLTYKSEDYGDDKDGLPFLTLKSISKSGGYSPRGLKFYKGEFKPKHILEQGDILFANTDLTRNGDVVGNPLYFDGLGFSTNPLYSMDLSKLVVDPKESDGKFLFYLLMTHRIRRFMVNASAGSTVLHLDTKQVKGLSVLLPPLPEQKKIASILTSVDEVIENTQSQIDKLQDLKKATMNELLTKGIGHTEFKDSELGRIPKSWKTHQLTEVCELKHGFQFRTPDFSDEGVRVVKIGQVVGDGALDLVDCSFVPNELAKTKSGFLLSAGDILMSLTGNIGRVGIVPDVQDKLLQNYRVGKFIPIEPKIEREFLSILLESKIVVSQLDTNSNSTAQANFGKSDLDKVSIDLPSIIEQAEITAVLNSISRTIIETRKKLVKTQSLKKSLMQDLLTGKVRVKLN